MSSATFTACPERYRFAAKGQRDIRVGRSTLHLRGVPDVRVDGARDAKNASVRAKFSGRTVADNPYVSREFRGTAAGVASCGRPSFIDRGLLHRTAEFHFQAFDFEWRSRANVDPHAGRFGNRIHRSSPADHADIKRGLRLRRDSGLSEKMKRMPQSHDRIRHAEIAPRVPTGSGNADLETAAAERLRDDGVATGAINHDAGRNGILPFGCRKNVAHAAQIAFAFLADVSDEQQGGTVR